MAVQERSVRNSVCLNHPERPASVRCSVCFKPVCEECAIRSEGSTFCSQACLANLERTQGGVAAWREQGARERARRRRRRLIKLIILVVVGVAAYVYFTRHPAKLDQLRDKAGNAANEVKKGLGK
jgi:hypothetical protein